MKKTIIALSATACIALLAAGVFFALPKNQADAASSLAINEPAPAFAGIDTKGNNVTLADYLGKIVVLEWTNHDCPYVQKHYNAGNMQELQNRVTASGGAWLRVISSAPGTQGHLSGQEVERIAATHGAAPTLTILDESGEIGQAYGAKTTPHMYIINPEGTLVYAGGIDDQPNTDISTIKTATNYVAAALDDLAASRPVAISASRPYGCNVKYK